MGWIYVAFWGDDRNAYRILLEISEGRKAHGKCSSRRKNNIVGDLKRYRIEGYGLNWMYVAQSSCCEHGDEFFVCINSRYFLKI
jgi:hypothetical protein